MVIVILLVLGLCLGSFVNALIWRLHEQEEKSSKSKNLNAQRSTLNASDLSILKGRSMCPNCHHELAVKDLIPVFSWLSLAGKCRYCNMPISWQYPLVELLTAGLFVFSYAYWPFTFNNQGTILFIFWLVFLIGFMALAVYDLRWYLLPNKVIYPLFVLAVLQTTVILLAFHGGFSTLSRAGLGVLVGGGIFYALFQLSKGKWIGGGDVKLGALLGLIIGGPSESLLMIFIASCLGTVVALPLMITGKAKRGSRLPFGPFLITAAIIVYLFGASLIAWYKRRFLLY